MDGIKFDISSKNDVNIKNKDVVDIFKLKNCKNVIFNNTSFSILTANDLECIE